MAWVVIPNELKQYQSSSEIAFGYLGYRPYGCTPMEINMSGTKYLWEAILHHFRRTEDFHDPEYFEGCTMTYGGYEIPLSEFGPHDYDNDDLWDYSNCVEKIITDIIHCDTSNFFTIHQVIMEEALWSPDIHEE